MDEVVHTRTESPMNTVGSMDKLGRGLSIGLSIEGGAGR
jgi:hypothetical protein